jgi:hypothetical protein
VTLHVWCFFHGCINFIFDFSEVRVNIHNTTVLNREKL